MRVSSLLYSVFGQRQIGLVIPAGGLLATVIETEHRALW